MGSLWLLVEVVLGRVVVVGGAATAGGGCRAYFGWERYGDLMVYLGRLAT